MSNIKDEKNERKKATQQIIIAKHVNIRLKYVVYVCKYIRFDRISSN